MRLLNLLTGLVDEVECDDSSIVIVSSVDVGGTSIYNLGSIRSMVVSDILVKSIKGIEGITDVKHIVIYNDVGREFSLEAEEFGYRISDYSNHCLKVFFDIVGYLGINTHYEVVLASSFLESAVNLIERCRTAGIACSADYGHIYTYPEKMPTYGSLFCTGFNPEQAEEVSSLRSSLKEVNEMIDSGMFDFLDCGSAQSSPGLAKDFTSFRDERRASIKSDYLSDLSNIVKAVHDDYSVLSFLLWEPATRGGNCYACDSPWGFGTPSFSACSVAAAESYLSDTLDIRIVSLSGDGRIYDEELGILESLTMAPYAKVWFPIGDVSDKGYSYSSLKHGGVSVNEARLVLSSSPIGSTLSSVGERLDSARRSLDRLQEVSTLVLDIVSLCSDQPLEGPMSSEIYNMLETDISNLWLEFYDCLENNLDTSGVFIVIFGMASIINNSVSAVDLIDEGMYPAAAVSMYIDAYNVMVSCCQFLGLDLETLDTVQAMEHALINGVEEGYETNEFGSVSNVRGLFPEQTATKKLAEGHGTPVFEDSMGVQYYSEIAMQIGLRFLEEDDRWRVCWCETTSDIVEAVGSYCSDQAVMSLKSFLLVKGLSELIDRLMAIWCGSSKEPVSLVKRSDVATDVSGSSTVSNHYSYKNSIVTKSVVSISFGGTELAPIYTAGESFDSSGIKASEEGYIFKDNFIEIVLELRRRARYSNEVQFASRVKDSLEELGVKLK
ncbi:MAG: hypothetical protein GY861_21350 [bacterium]|nr:hypothetical protein [bacterium]